MSLLDRLLTAALACVAFLVRVVCTLIISRGDMLADIKRVAKKIQGALPIVGLLSRLSAPGGGFDEIVRVQYEWVCIWALWGV
jgi:hypothetical protein